MKERAMGLDLGTKSCGIAISDILGIAHGREEYRFNDGDYPSCLMHVLDLAKREGIRKIILGYPLNMDGSEGESARRSLSFKEMLEQKEPTLEVILVDERMTSVMAERSLLESDISRKKRKKVIDKQSAILILETYLDMEEKA